MWFGHRSEIKRWRKQKLLEYNGFGDGDVIFNRGSAEVCGVRKKKVIKYYIQRNDFLKNKGRSWRDVMISADRITWIKHDRYENRGYGGLIKYERDGKRNKMKDVIFNSGW